MPRTSSKNPCRISEAKTVLLSPSVTDATFTRLGPVAAVLMPNGAWQVEGGVGLEERCRVGIA